MKDVLVLNKNFFPVHITWWQEAMTLLVTERASVVDHDYRTYSFDNWKELSKMIENHPHGYIHTPSMRIAIPDVIVLRKWDRLPPGNVKFTRKNIYHHYKNRCCYCGKRYDTSKLNLDHVIPRSKGGMTNWSNIVLSCIPCNQKKRNRTPKEANMTMEYTPNAPKWKPCHVFSLKGPAINSSWQKFIDTVYWNSEIDNV